MYRLGRVLLKGSDYMIVRLTMLQPHQIRVRTWRYRSLPEDIIIYKTIFEKVITRDRRLTEIWKVPRAILSAC